MQEKRRSKRFPAKLELEISQLFKQNNVMADISAPIEVIDVSKLGIGFKSKSVLHWITILMQNWSWADQINAYSVW